MRKDDFIRDLQEVYAKYGLYLVYEFDGAFIQEAGDEQDLLEAQQSLEFLPLGQATIDV